MKSYDYSHRSGVRQLDWDDFSDMARQIAEQLERHHPQLILGIARAGLFPATVVACSLRCELFPIRLTRRVNDQVVYERPVWKVRIPIDVKGKIIAVIDEIADQTNLLALNAAIESARAGEQGRGFAVVANEVKKLAERTTAATKEIADMINGIRQDTRKAVESMQFCTREVTSGSDFSGKAGNSLQAIVVSSQNVTDMIRRIAAAVEQQSAATSEITSNLSEIANITHQTNEGARRSSESSRRLRETALELKELAGEFRLRNGDNERTMQS